jgi:hypothetical protein
MNEAEAIGRRSGMIVDSFMDTKFNNKKPSIF